MISENIKTHRDRLGINKATLARMVGVSDVTVGYWENGKIQAISSDSLLQLGRVFGVTVSELIDDPIWKEQNQ